MSRALLVCLALFAAALPAAAAEQPVLRAVAAERIGPIGAETLRLRGMGLFRYMGVKLYMAFFYTKPDVAEPDMSLGRHPMRLVFRYMHDIPRDALVKAAETNLQRNAEVDYPKIRERVERLHERYTDLKKGDECALVYANGKTIALFKNKPIIEIEGEDFARAYFGIWLSKYSINQKLRKNLLGEKKSR